MASSAVSPLRRASTARGSRTIHLRSWGLALLALAAPGLLRLPSAPDPALAGLAVAALLLLGLSARWCRRQAARIELERRVPAEVRAREPFRVQLVVTLHGGAPVTGLVLGDEFTAGRTLAGSGFYIPALLPDKPVRCAYGALSSASRGWQRLSRAVLTIEDPLGLVSLSVTRPLASEWLVLPAVHDLGEGRLVSPASRTAAEEQASQESGAGEELAGTREWRPGDRMRDIHWRSSAKTGVLVVRENARVVRPDLAVLLHLFRPAPWSATDDEPAEAGGAPRALRWGLGLLRARRRPRLSAAALELCVEAAAAVLEWGPAAGYRTSVYLAALQPWVAEGVLPGHGVQDALRRLAVAEAQSTAELQDVLASVHARLSPGAVVVLAAPAASVASPAARAAVAGLRARGHRVAAVLGWPEPDREVWPDPSAALAAAGVETVTLAAPEDVGDLLRVLAKLPVPA
jgi:hypothetical protein